MQCKYIVIDGIMAVIFSDLMVHAEVAAGLRRYGKVTGAGFVSIGANNYELEVTPYGRSESLDIDSNKEEDTAAIKRALGRID